MRPSQRRAQAGLSMEQNQPSRIQLTELTGVLPLFDTVEDAMQAPS
jgi:hypothetical protein